MFRIKKRTQSDCSQAEYRYCMALLFQSYSQVHNKRGGGFKINEGGGLKDFEKLLNGGWEQNIKGKRRK